MARLNFNTRKVKPEGQIALPAVYDDLTPRERALAREQYVEKQNGRCIHCQARLDGQPAEQVLAQHYGELSKGKGTKRTSSGGAREMAEGIGLHRQMGGAAPLALK